MRKKLVMSVIVMSIVFSFGLAGLAGAADSPKLPQHVLDTHAGQGTMATLVVWFPFIPEAGSPFNWASYVILSNFYNTPVTVNVWATAWGQAPTQKIYTLSSYEKKIITLADFGITGDTFADVYCSSSSWFGAAALLLDTSTGVVQTAFPPVTWTY